MRIVVDMNLAPSWSERLTAEGFDAVHWSSIGAPTASDEDIVAHAAATSAVMVTHDLDFPAILAATQRARPSVVLLPGGAPTWERFGPTVCAALRHFEEEVTSGAVLVLGLDRVRVRLLPFSDPGGTPR